MMETLSELKSNWSDKDWLSSYIVYLLERQLELAELIAAEDLSLTNSFVSEKEESYKGTDSMARARAKMLVGNNKIKYEYEFEALNNIIKVVSERISRL